ncbi:MAG: glycosyltransferase family 1 protein [Polyangiaceae bacterium]|nr:glycosyltransferase family 1 protein [Polyangiaceae bacterium]
MRALLSVVGTRGDVQPVLALALEVRALGHEVRLCVPPNFVEWAERLGFAATAVGIEMRSPKPGAPPIQIPDLIADQFDTIGAAARGCDVILGANAHQHAARSVAELRGVPYVNALYAPTSLPDDANTRIWNERSLERVNANRVRLGLAPIADLLRHVVTDAPWLATDPTLDPAPSMHGKRLVQTGAWILDDSSPLPAHLLSFLDGGEPPIYLGFGSMPVAEGTSRKLVEAARAVGRRAIVSKGWADLGLIDESPDCIAIDDINQQALFRCVAAVVHHGGAGTTLTAARAAAPQVVVPMFSDQPFWAGRVCDLGIGASVPIAALTTDALTSALKSAFEPATVERASSIAEKIVVDGARIAARRLVDEVR